LPGLDLTAGRSPGRAARLTGPRSVPTPCGWPFRPVWPGQTPWPCRPARPEDARTRANAHRRAGASWP